MASTAAPSIGVYKAGFLTRDAILKASLEHFNQYGIENASLGTICREVGIAVGNLNYYFPRKIDIVGNLQNDFTTELVSWSEELAVFSEKCVEVSPDFVYYVLTRTFDISWNYRFIFNSLSLIQQMDPNFYSSLAEAEHKARVSVARLIQGSIDEGVVRPLSYPNSVTALAENIWRLMISSMLVQLDQEKSLGPLKTEMMRACLLQIGAMFEPLVSRDFIGAFCQRVARHCQNDSLTAPM